MSLARTLLVAGALAFVSPAIAQTTGSETCTTMNAIESQICNKLTQVWSQTIGKAQCGITLTGFQMGFLGGSTLGGGLSCPKISIGGGGPTIMSIGVGPTNSGKLTVTGNAVAPTGYSITSLLGLF
jgi:hypothetical protein